MPEYLAPGVYVEEIPSGNKPIQAASTSTAGMVGMTARGPVNRPTLVTSLGSFARIFGGALDPRVFTAGRDALPYAAEGFFANLGARLYVVRVVGPSNDESRLRLVASSGVEASPTLAAGAAGGQNTVLLDDRGELAAEDTMLISGGSTSEFVTVAEADPFVARPVLGGGLRESFPAAATVTPQTVSEPITTATTALPTGATSIVVADVTGIAADVTLQLANPDPDPDPGAEPDDETEIGEAELVTVATVDADTATVTLADPLRGAHPVGATLSSLADGDATELTDPAGPSSVPVFLRLDDPAGVDAGTWVRLSTVVGTETVEELALVTAVVTEVTLTEELAATHAPGATVTPAVEVLTVHARWPGGWGDSLRVTAFAADPLARTTTTAAAPAEATTLPVANPIGLYSGSAVLVGGTATAQVTGVDTDTGMLTLSAPTTAEIADGSILVSQEFGLLVERIEAGRAVESERFDQLSLAPAHPRYAPTVVGGWDTATDRPSDSGTAQLIRLSIPAGNPPRDRPLVTGVARLLAGGRDDAAGVVEDTYVGTAADARTGIQALENEPTLSIVAVPGQTSVTVQGALVEHCEKMRYRFAVLDVPPGATLDQARAHRQNFDTTRAAIYYPDLSIADRFGAPGDRRMIAPSGHVLGVYARTDLTRGVHKAPANEVIRGALGLRTGLTKGEQDILNPINLNCLRDFRSENRGLRVYGARVATSDPEWRYVNVRRLLLFIEQSLDTGLQFAVFEPNDKPLWDTVKQSITGFLTTVWRSGALEGVTAEEAYFVNIGYDVTMDQADIDNGRLIVEVGVAPVKPAEFVIVRISQKTREATA